MTALLLFATPSCVSAPGSSSRDATGEQAPIDSPFGSFQIAPQSENSNITLRSRKGDQSVEVEFPQTESSELSVPMNLKHGIRGTETALGETAENGVDYQYVKHKPTGADREIASTFNSKDDPIADAKKREIENNLGLQASDELLNMDESYLAKVDVVKQLFRGSRFEAALIEIDSLLKLYPTNAKLYEMRGTLLDRLGYPDLALRSWKQALEFEPRKLALKKLVEKREAQRNVASEKR